MIFFFNIINPCGSKKYINDITCSDGQAIEIHRIYAGTWSFSELFSKKGPLLQSFQESDFDVKNFGFMISGYIWDLDGFSIDVVSYMYHIVLL